MARKHYSEMTPERNKELRKQYRNPPTREYQQMRVLRVALLCLALLFQKHTDLPLLSLATCLFLLQFF